MFWNNQLATLCTGTFRFPVFLYVTKGGSMTYCGASRGLARAAHNYGSYDVSFLGFNNEMANVFLSKWRVYLWLYRYIVVKRCMMGIWWSFLYDCNDDVTHHQCMRYFWTIRRWYYNLGQWPLCTLAPLLNVTLLIQASCPTFLYHFPDHYFSYSFLPPPHL